MARASDWADYLHIPFFALSLFRGIGDDNLHRLRRGGFFRPQIVVLSLPAP
ncbi:MULTISPECIES: hypothetical protein [Morganellaceae]|uniref:hypothetical protein n=1 Tax=Morganellaceae TaxID=1903414 RepID=UPI0013A57BA1|nr:hypothetical protein [Proteus mirabilis]UNH29177.1 hypothetical protein MNY64_16715 [Moellerella wisconsensis]HDS6495387.1 hypothetical protein [Proteus mirabilis]HDS8387750.1 hypothetical protein [Proteus mirabilis]HDT1685606.1 hypothetical protein [Proteus mirabilis]